MGQVDRVESAAEDTGFHAENQDADPRIQKEACGLKMSEFMSLGFILKPEF
jgi:hypothetical protein